MSYFSKTAYLYLAEEKPVSYVTTFEKAADGTTKSKVVKVTDDEGILIEEILSDVESNKPEGEEEIEFEEIKGSYYFRFMFSKSSSCRFIFFLSVNQL